MGLFFKKESPYVIRARIIAALWTLLIFFLCFLPGRDIPNVAIPLVDKWAHVILFGIFCFLWHCTTPTSDKRYRLTLLVIAIFIGWLVEYVQGHYVAERSQDNMDILADSFGGFIGILCYAVIYHRANRRKQDNPV